MRAPQVPGSWRRVTRSRCFQRLPRRGNDRSRAMRSPNVRLSRPAALRVSWISACPIAPGQSFAGFSANGSGETLGWPQPSNRASDARCSVSGNTRHFPHSTQVMPASRLAKMPMISAPLDLGRAIVPPRYGAEDYRRSGNHPVSGRPHAFIIADLICSAKLSISVAAYPLVSYTSDICICPRSVD